MIIECASYRPIVIVVICYWLIRAAIVVCSGWSRVSRVGDFSVGTDRNTRIRKGRAGAHSPEISDLCNAWLLNYLINVVDLISTLALARSSIYIILIIIEYDMCRRRWILLFVIFRLMIEPMCDCFGCKMLIRLILDGWLSQHTDLMLSVKNLSRIHNTLNKTVRYSILNDRHLTDRMLLVESSTAVKTGILNVLYHLHLRCWASVHHPCGVPSDHNSWAPLLQATNRVLMCAAIACSECEFLLGFILAWHDIILWLCQRLLNYLRLLFLNQTWTEDCTFPLKSSCLLLDRQRQRKNISTGLKFILLSRCLGCLEGF